MDEHDPSDRTQLCLAMADLILLMPEWKNSVPELMQKLSDSPRFVAFFDLLQQPYTLKR